MPIKMILASTAALAMVAGTPAFAAKNQNRELAAVGSGGGGEKAKKICRTFPNSATRMKREKLCLTRAEWKNFRLDEG